MQNLDTDDAQNDSSSRPPPRYPYKPPTYQAHPNAPDYESEPFLPAYTRQPTPGYPAQPPAIGGPPQAPITHQPQLQQPGYPAGHMTNTHTTVVIQQQTPTVLAQVPRRWTTGIWDCCADSEICLLGCFCPWFLPPYVSCMADEFFCVGWLCPTALRAVIRERYNIQGNISDDCCVIYCDYINAFCQMARELKIRKGS